MSEKKAKEERQQPSHEATITLRRNAKGEFEVSGHIQSPILAFEMMGSACLTLAEYYTGAAKKAAPRIVQPKPGLILPH